MVTVFDLRVDNSVQPICINRQKPMFSWKFKDCNDRFYQSSYRIIASTSIDKLNSFRGDLWDSGRVEGSENFGIQYNGETLLSRMNCFWKVMVWDEHGVPSEWSINSSFRVGLLSENDWLAKWISYKRDFQNRFDPQQYYYVADNYDKGENELFLPEVPCFRKEFSVRKGVVQSTAYVSALGLYELRLDGNKVGNSYLNPGWSDYNKHVYYDCYDLKLEEGEHVLGALLSDGWYSGYVGLVSRNVWGDTASLIIQLEILYEDGSTQTVSTDDTWNVKESEIIEADLLHGETVDARRIIKDWDNINCVTDKWNHVIEITPSNKPTTARIGPRTVLIQKLKPVSYFEDDEGNLIYDFGKNITGFVRIEDIHELRGTEIVVDYAEILVDGSFDRKVYRSARATDKYISSGESPESFEPKFTFRGFRYARIRGMSRTPKTIDVFGMFIAAEFESLSSFSCSNSTVNSVHDLLKQTIKCGYIEVPMDCCERDERLGWGQDGNHSLQLGSYLFNIRNFIRKWLQDIIDSQSKEGSYGPTAPKIEMGDIGQFKGDIMSDCGLHAAWILFSIFGDKLCVEEVYESLKKYYAFMKNNSDRNMRNSIAGDWLQLLANGRTDFIHGWGNTSRDLVGTAFFALGSQMMAKFAELLSLKEDELLYSRQFQDTKKAFINTFELRNSNFRDNTQTGYALALSFDLVSDQMRPILAKKLADDVINRNYSITGGIPGSAYILNALSENGYHEVATKVMSNEEYPGYGYMIKAGGTTCWERWDAIHPTEGVHPHNMNSYNHIGLSAAGTWLYKKVAGIEAIEPGFKSIRIKPYYEGDITSATAYYECGYGKIEVSWKKVESLVELTISIPPNTSAEVHLPEMCRVISAPDVEVLKDNNGLMKYFVTNGKFGFEFILSTI